MNLDHWKRAIVGLNKTVLGDNPLGRSPKVTIGWMTLRGVLVIGVQVTTTSVVGNVAENVSVKRSTMKRTMETGFLNVDAEVDMKSPAKVTRIILMTGGIIKRGKHQGTSTKLHPLPKMNKYRRRKNPSRNPQKKRRQKRLKRLKPKHQRRRPKKAQAKVVHNQ